MRNQHKQKKKPEAFPLQAFSPLSKDALYSFLVIEQIDTASNDSKEDSRVPNKAKCIAPIRHQTKVLSKRKRLCFLIAATPL